MKKIWIKSVKPDDFINIKLGDWIENVGVVATYFEMDFIKNYGELLLAKKGDIK